MRATRSSSKSLPKSTRPSRVGTRRSATRRVTTVLVRRALVLALVLAAAVGVLLLQPRDEALQAVRAGSQRRDVRTRAERSATRPSSLATRGNASVVVQADAASRPTRGSSWGGTACAELWDVGRAPCLPHRFVFVGGLRRSGTSTTVGLLQQLEGASALEFDPLRPEHMEAAPWKALVDVHTGRRMKWAYFKEVIATGGAEGKLLQSVYPYRYALLDAKQAPLAALLAHPSAISPLISNASRRLLWAQWRRFWRPAAVFLDKSPENILMAPFLQGLFGARRTGFLFVLRHPLAWALAASKWGCTWYPLPAAEGTPAEGTPAGKAPAPECIEYLLHVWLAVHERVAAQLPGLRRAVLLRVESAEWSSLAWAKQAGLPRPPAALAQAWAETQRSVLRKSHQYVHCFLRGSAPAPRCAAPPRPVPIPPRPAPTRPGPTRPLPYPPRLPTCAARQCCSPAPASAPCFLHPASPDPRPHRPPARPAGLPRGSSARHAARRALGRRARRRGARGCSGS